MNDWVVIFETGQLYRAELVKSLQPADVGPDEF